MQSWLDEALLVAATPDADSAGGVIPERDALATADRASNRDDAVPEDKSSPDSERRLTWLSSPFDQPWGLFATSTAGMGEFAINAGVVLGAAGGDSQITPNAPSLALFQNPTAEGMRVGESPSPPPLLADTDGDGIAGTMEAAGPNGGDGNRDGIADGVIVDPGGSTTSTFVTLVAIDTTAAKFKVDDVTGSGTGAFAVFRAGELTDPLTVHYTVDLSSTAVAGSDYQALTGSVTIAAGQHRAGIVVRPLDNAAVDSTKSVRIALAESPYYYIVNPETVEVSITETIDIHPELIEATGDRPKIGVVTLDPTPPS